MAHPRAALPPGLVGSAFSVADGRRAGLTVDQLRRSSLRSPTRGVRTGAPPPGSSDLLGRCRELLPVLPSDAVFCHVTALGLLGADLPWGTDLDGPLHVQVGPASSWPRRHGVRAHSRSTADVRSWRLPGGVRVLVPELVWVQLGAHLEVPELVVLGDALLRRRDALSHVDRLRSAVAGLPAGTRGARRLRAAAGHVRARTDSPMESRLRWLLVDAGLRCPEVNVPVRGPDGSVVAMPDLSYVPERVAVEYDGDVHRTSRTVWRRDVTRRQALEALGWRVVSCTADDVIHHPARAVAWVRSALARASAPSRLQ
jgi:very-short-patch-repair endonuclease